LIEATAVVTKRDSTSPLSVPVFLALLFLVSFFSFSVLRAVAKTKAITAG